MKKETKEFINFVFHVFLILAVIPVMAMNYIVGPIFMPEHTEYEPVFDFDQMRAEPPFDTAQISFTSNCNETIIIYIELKDFQGRDFHTIQVIENKKPYGELSGRFPCATSFPLTYQATLYRANETIQFDFYLNQSYTNIRIYEDQIWEYTKEYREVHGEDNTVWWESVWKYRLLLWERD